MSPRKSPLASDVDPEHLAAATRGMTGADLANLANEAALLAARRKRDAVHQRHLTDALEKVQLGTARNGYAEARRILRENRNRLDAIVAELLAHESLDESEIYAAAGIERTAATPSPAPVPA